MAVADDLAKSAARIAERALKERQSGDIDVARILAQQAAQALAFAKAIGWKPPVIGPKLTDRTVNPRAQRKAGR